MARAPVVPGRPLTQGALVSVEEAIGSSARAFHAAEATLRAELERVVAAIALDPDSTKRYRDAQIRALLARSATLRAELQGQATLFVEESLAKVYADGMLRADRITSAQGIALGGQPSWTLMHREALEILAVDAHNDLAAATDYMDAQAKRTIREATKARAALSVAAGTDVRQDTRALVRTLSTQGVTGFVDAAGRNWRLGPYAEMVLRTKSAHAYNTGTALRCEETGTYAMRIADGERSDHAECLAFSGQTCTPAWALDHPIQHPNCVRSFGPLPLHRGPVDHGDAGDSAVKAAQREAARRRDLGDLPSDLTMVLPDLPGGPGTPTPARTADALDDVLANPARWTEGATRRTDGRMMPGEPALEANRALLARGRAVDDEITDRLAARNVRQVRPDELLEAETTYHRASVDYGRTRDAWVDAKVAEGYEWGDAFEASVNQLLHVDDPRWTTPPGLELGEEVWAARRAAQAAEEAYQELFRRSRAYDGEWQDELRTLLRERRGSGYVPTTPTVRIDASIADTVTEAFDRYPAAWADTFDAKLTDFTVNDAKGTRGWNRTGGRSGGQVSSILNTEGLSTTIHEIGHTFEAIIPGLREAEWTFLRNRAAGARGGLEPTRVIPGYARTEK